MGLGLKKYIFQFIAGNSRIISYLLCVACVVLTLLLPVAFSRGTYFSENSLNIGQSDTACTEIDVARIEMFATRIKNFAGDEDRIKQFLYTEMSESGNYPTTQQDEDGMSIFTTVPSHRGVGSAAFLVVAHSEDYQSAGLVLQIINKIKDSPWLGLDLHVLIVISGDYESRIRAYATQESISVQTIQAAVVLDFHDDFNFDTLYLKTLSDNGMQPNMDFVNSAALLSKSARLPSTVFLNSSDVSVLPDVVRQFITSNWNLIREIPNVRASSPRELQENIVRFWSYLVQAAVSDSPSVHTPLRELGIHSLTLSGKNSKKGISRSQLSNVCYIVLQLVRGINNLCEKLHQSFWIYLFTNEEQFVDYDQFQAQIWIGGGSVIASTFLFKFYTTDFVSSLLVVGLLLWMCVGGVVVLMPTLATITVGVVGLLMCDNGCVQILRLLLSLYVVSFLVSSTVMYPSVGVIAAVHSSLVASLTINISNRVVSFCCCCIALFVTYSFDSIFRSATSVIPWSYHICCIPFTAVCIATSLMYSNKKKVKTE